MGWNVRTGDQLVEVKFDAAGNEHWRPASVVSASEDIVTVRFEDGAEEVIGQDQIGERFQLVNADTDEAE